MKYEIEEVPNFTFGEDKHPALRIVQDPQGYICDTQEHIDKRIRQMESTSWKLKYAVAFVLVRFVFTWMSMVRLKNRSVESVKRAWRTYHWDFIRPEVDRLRWKAVKK